MNYYLIFLDNNTNKMYIRPKINLFPHNTHFLDVLCLKLLDEFETFRFICDLLFLLIFVGVAVFLKHLHDVERSSSVCNDFLYDMFLANF